MSLQKLVKVKGNDAYSTNDTSKYKSSARRESKKENTLRGVDHSWYHVSRTILMSHDPKTTIDAFDLQCNWIRDSVHEENITPQSSDNLSDIFTCGNSLTHARYYY